MTQHSRPARFARLRVFLTALCFAGTADVLAAPMVYVPDSSTGKIAIVDSANGAMAGEIVTGRDPRGIAIHPDGNTLYVGNFEGKSLSIIDALSQQEKAHIPLPGIVQGVAVKPDGSAVYVANGNSVTVVNATSHAMVATIPVDGSPRGVIVSRSGQSVYTSNYAAGTLSILDSATHTKTATITLASGSYPGGLAEHPGSGRVYISGWGTNKLYVVDPQKRSVLTSITVGYRPGAVAMSPDGKFVYVCMGGELHGLGTGGCRGRRYREQQACRHDRHAAKQSVFDRSRHPSGWQQGVCHRLQRRSVDAGSRAEKYCRQDHGKFASLGNG